MERYIISEIEKLDGINSVHCEEKRDSYGGNIVPCLEQSHGPGVYDIKIIEESGFIYLKVTVSADGRTGKRATIYLGDGISEIGKRDAGKAKKEIFKLNEKLARYSHK